jgi:hypothetical protein
MVDQTLDQGTPEDYVREHSSWTNLTVQAYLHNYSVLAHGPFFLALFNDEDHLLGPLQLTPRPLELGADKLYFEPVSILVRSPLILTHHLLFSVDNQIRRSGTFDHPIVVHPNDRHISIRMTLNLMDSNNG